MLSFAVYRIGFADFLPTSVRVNVAALSRRSFWSQRLTHASTRPRNLMPIHRDQDDFLIRNSTSSSKQTADEEGPPRCDDRDVRVVALRVRWSMLRATSVRPVQVGRMTVGRYEFVTFAYRRGMFDALTHRERQILAFVGHGIGNKGIAYRLGISESTVKKHFVSITKKLGVGSRAQMARLVAVASPLEERRRGAEGCVPFRPFRLP